MIEQHHDQYSSPNSFLVYMIKIEIKFNAFVYILFFGVLSNRLYNVTGIVRLWECTHTSSLVLQTTSMLQTSKVHGGLALPRT